MATIDSQILSDRARAEAAKVVAELAETNAQASEDQALASVNALSAVTFDRGFSGDDDLTIVPTTSGATDGDISWYLPSNNAFQIIRLESGVWQDFGEPVTTKKYVDDKASLLQSDINDLQEATPQNIEMLWYPVKVIPPSFSFTGEGILSGSSERKIIKRTGIGLDNFTNDNPMVIAHRNGRLLRPEHSLDGFVDSRVKSIIALEPDVIATSDDFLAMSHDNDASSLTDGTGNISAITADTWKGFTIDASTDPPGWSPQNASIFEDLISELGQNSIYVPELKRADQVVLKDYLDSISADKTKFLIQSFDKSRLTIFKDAGYETMPMYSSPPSLATLQSLKQDGYNWVGMQADFSDSVISDAVSAGLKPIIWTCNRRERWEELQAVGAVGVFSDDPEYIADYSSDEDTWDTGFLMPGMFTSGLPEESSGSIGDALEPERRGVIFDGGWGWPGNTAVTRDFVLQGWATPPFRKGSDNWSVDFTINIPAQAGSTSNWCAIAMHDSQMGDLAYTDNGDAWEMGYNCIIRRNGNMSIFKRTGSSTTTLANVDGDSVPDGVDVKMRLEVTPTEINWQRLDSSGAVIQEATTTNTDYRGGYFSFGRALISVNFSNVVITRND